jgi:hypothetical protein
MLAEMALKKAHDEMLNKCYDKAIEEGWTAIAETKLMIAAIKHMQERRK